MQGFEKYTREMEKFRESKLFKDKYERFVWTIKIAIGNPVGFKELETNLGIKGSQVRELVRHARREGIPIASCGDGYSLARTPAEISDTIQHFTERCNSMYFTLSRLKSVFEPDGQTEMFV